MPGASHNYGGLSILCCSPPTSLRRGCVCGSAGEMSLALAALLELAGFPSGSLLLNLSATPGPSVPWTRRRLPLVRSSWRATRAWRLLVAYATYQSIQLAASLSFLPQVVTLASSRLSMVRARSVAEIIWARRRGGLSQHSALPGPSLWAIMLSLRRGSLYSQSSRRCIYCR